MKKELTVCSANVAQLTHVLRDVLCENQETSTLAPKSALIDSLLNVFRGSAAGSYLRLSTAWRNLRCSSVYLFHGSSRPQEFIDAWCCSTPPAEALTVSPWSWRFDCKRDVGPWVSSNPAHALMYARWTPCDDTSVRSSEAAERDHFCSQSPSTCVVDSCGWKKRVLAVCAVPSLDTLTMWNQFTSELVASSFDAASSSWCWGTSERAQVRESFASGNIAVAFQHRLIASLPPPPSSSSVLRPPSFSVNSNSPGMGDHDASNNQCGRNEMTLVEDVVDGVTDWLEGAAIYSFRSGKRSRYHGRPPVSVEPVLLIEEFQPECGHIIH